MLVMRSLAYGGVWLTWWLFTGHAEYPAVKLLHYGKIEECVAYLSRRALENKSAVPTADKV